MFNLGACVCLVVIVLAPVKLSAVVMNELQKANQTLQDVEQFVSSVSDGVVKNISNQMQVDMLTKLLSKERYMPALRPIRTEDDDPMVSVGMRLIRLKEFDPTNFRAIVRAQLILNWNDYRLTWKNDNHSMRSILISNDGLIWLPDVTLLQGGQLSHDQHATIEIQHNGNITWQPIQDFEMVCYPRLDRLHSCFLQIASYTHSGRRISLKSIGISKSRHFVQHPLYDVTSMNRSDSLDRTFLPFQFVKSIKFDVKITPCAQCAFDRDQIKGLQNYAVAILCATWLLFFLPGNDRTRYCLAAVFVLSYIIVGCVNAVVKNEASTDRVATDHITKVGIWSLIILVITLSIIDWLDEVRNATVPAYLTKASNVIGKMLFLKNPDASARFSLVNQSAASGDVNADDNEDPTSGDPNAHPYDNNVGSKDNVPSNSSKSEWSYVSQILRRLTCIAYVIVTLVLVIF